MPECTVDKCPNLAAANGLCRKHYMRVQRTGTPDDPKPRKRKTCSIPDCGRPAVSGGLCQLHHRRKRRVERADDLQLVAERFCVECGVRFPSESRSDRVFCTQKCKARNQYKREFARKNESAWAYQIKHKFGITAKRYWKLLDEQDGKCAICDSENPRGRGKFHVDHCHTTGKVRGLLCSECNVAIGKLKDDPDIVERAAAYLRR